MKPTFLIGLCIALFSSTLFAQVQDAPIEVQRIDHFDLSDTKRTRFGSFEFVGGLVLSSSNQHLGSVSGLRIGNDGRFTAVEDTGFWLQGRIEWNEDGKPSAIKNGKIAPILDVDGAPFKQKWSADIEGLTVGADGVYASTEMDMRVIRFPLNTADPLSIELLLKPSERITGDIPANNIRVGFAFEAIATLPHNHPMAPALLVLSENDKNGNNKATGFILKDDALLPLTVQQSDGHFITDADFLPDGDLLILERRFSMGSGPAMRIRKVSGKEIKPNALLEGDVILEAGANHDLDNMEALSVFTGPDGKVRIGIMSDDNHWLMQRTLYLEFAYQP